MLKVHARKSVDVNPLGVSARPGSDTAKACGTTATGTTIFAFTTSIDGLLGSRAYSRVLTSSLYEVDGGSVVLSGDSLCSDCPSSRLIEEFLKVRL